MNIRVEIYKKSVDLPLMTDHTLFHSKELFALYEETRGHTPIMFVAYEGDRYLMHLLAVVQRDKRLLSHLLVRRCVVLGEGDCDDAVDNKEEVFGAVVTRLTEWALHNSFAIEFRNLSDSLFGYRYFRANGYFPVNWLRVYNSLHGEKTVEQRLSPSRLRQLKKAFRTGAEVREVQSKEEVHLFVRMLRHVYSSHIRKYFPDETFFFNIFRHSSQPGVAKTFVVCYKEKIIGGAVCIYSGTTAYLWFSGGMRKTYAAQYPGVLAVWKAMSDARASGYRHFEFMDVGLPFKRHGFREFVLRFGGKQVSTRRWFHFRMKWLNRLFVRLYS
jgi:hypothetical protein